MLKLNLGAGDNILPGWENHDIDVDITKPLPWADNTVDAIFAEHVVEHVTTHEALRFFDECYRILKPGGVVRITVPCIFNVLQHADQEYIDFCADNFGAERTLNGAVRSLIFLHGHQAAWDWVILGVFLEVSGFKAPDGFGSPIFNGVNGHHKVIGEKFNAIESISVEGVK